MGFKSRYKKTTPTETFYVVDLVFSKPIGPSPLRLYHEASSRSKRIGTLVRAGLAAPMARRLENPYFYASTKAKRAQFKVPKEYMNSVAALSSALASSKARKLGIASYRIRRCRETRVFTREYEELCD